MTFSEALAYLSGNSGPSNDPLFREACETVAANIAELQYRIFFQLPGGLSGNDDSAWEAVKEASHPTCNCGNERFFEPLDVRQEFQPAASGPVTLKMGERMFIKPKGSTNQSAYSLLELVKDPNGAHLVPTSNPLVENVGIALDWLFGRKGYPINMFEKVLPGNEPILKCKLASDRAVPVIQIIGADVNTQTLTFVPDAGVEMFTLEPAEATA